MSATLGFYLAMTLLARARPATSTLADVATTPKSTVMHDANLEKATTPQARAAALADLARKLRRQPHDDPRLVKQLRFALRDPDQGVRTRAAEVLLALAPASRSATDVAVDELLNEDDPEALAVVLTRIAVGSEDLFVRATHGLRKTVLEGTGPRHRARARRALLVLLRARQEGGLALRTGVLAEPACFTLDGAEPVCVDPTLFRLADEGTAGVETLLAAIRAPKPPAERLVAANSLALTGVMPTPEMVEQLVAAQSAETDRLVRLEDLLALAAFAERSKDALVSFQTLLLAEADCNLAESLSLSLPSHDLRLTLYKHLASKDALRARQVRQWVRGSPFWKECR